MSVEPKETTENNQPVSELSQYIRQPEECEVELSNQQYQAALEEKEKFSQFWDFNRALPLIEEAMSGCAYLLAGITESFKVDEGTPVSILWDDCLLIWCPVYRFLSKLAEVLDLIRKRAKKRVLMI